VGDEEAVVGFWFDDVAAGEGAEGGEGEDVLAEVEAGEAEGAVFPVADFDGGVDVAGDVELVVVGFLRVVDDADVLGVEVIRDLDFRGNFFDFCVVISLDKRE
jgi:hypothetical protein